MHEVKNVHTLEMRPQVLDYIRCLKDIGPGKQFETLISHIGKPTNVHPPFEAWLKRPANVSLTGKLIVQINSTWQFVPTPHLNQQ